MSEIGPNTEDSSIISNTRLLTTSRILIGVSAITEAGILAYDRMRDVIENMAIRATPILPAVAAAACLYIYKRNLDRQQNFTLGGPGFATLFNPTTDVITAQEPAASTLALQTVQELNLDELNVFDLPNGQTKYGYDFSQVSLGEPIADPSAIINAAIFNRFQIPEVSPGEVLTYRMAPMSEEERRDRQRPSEEEIFVLSPKYLHWVLSYGSIEDLDECESILRDLQRKSIKSENSQKITQIQQLITGKKQRLSQSGSIEQQQSQIPRPEERRKPALRTRYR